MNHGWVDVVFGEVECIPIADEVIMPDGKIVITRIWPLARLDYCDYTFGADVFEMRIPGASGAAAAGLEEKASNND